jgi:acetyl-CoA carboxylase biotin carboxyl carrier protein
MDLTDEDVSDILALLDSLPYDELDLQTARFRLTLRRGLGGWTQSRQVLAEPSVLDIAVAVPGAAAESAVGSMAQRAGYSRPDGTLSRSSEDADGSGEADVADGVSGETAGSGGKARGAEEAGGASGSGKDLVAVRAPLPGTFYRAPRPGAEPFVEVGSRVTEDTVVGIVETMKLMNSVHAAVAGTVAEICLANAEFAANGATLMRIEADR